MWKAALGQGGFLGTDILAQLHTSQLHRLPEPFRAAENRMVTAAPMMDELLDTDDLFLGLLSANPHAQGQQIQKQRMADAWKAKDAKMDGLHSLLSPTPAHNAFVSQPVHQPGQWNSASTRSWKRSSSFAQAAPAATDLMQPPTTRQSSRSLERGKRRPGLLPHAMPMPCLALLCMSFPGN